MTRSSEASGSDEYVAAIIYDPPRQADDPRICGNCLGTTGSWSGARWWPILNQRTGKYHSGGDYGVTDCGIDATKEHFSWPI